MKKVKMYIKRTCPYCVKAKEVLVNLGYKIEDIEQINIEENPISRDEMMAITQRKTVPQIFIGEVHVGGCDDLVALVEQGKIAELIKD